LLTASQYLENATGDEIDIYADSRHMNTKPKILNACVITNLWQREKRTKCLELEIWDGAVNGVTTKHLDGFIIRGKQLEAIPSYQNFCISIFVALAPGQAKLLSNQS